MKFFTRHFALFALLMISFCSCSKGTGNGSPQDYYDQARVARDAGDLVQATVLFQEALEAAERMGDDYYAGYACQQLSLLFAQTFDYGEALRYARRAVRSLDACGESLAANFSRIDLGRQYVIMGRTERASRLVDSLWKAGPLRDSSLVYYLCVLDGDIHYLNGRYDRARELYDRAGAMDFPLTLEFYGLDALLTQQLGRPERADSLLACAATLVKSSSDSVLYYSYRQDLDLLRHDYRAAYDDLSAVSDIQDRAVSTVLAQSAIHAMKAYFEESYQVEKARRQTQMLLSVLVTILLAGVIALVTFLLRKKERQMVAEMEKMEDLSRDFRRLVSQQESTDAILMTLVQDKVKTMQGLADTYFQWTDDAVSYRDHDFGPAQRDDVIRAFRSELFELRSDANIIPAVERALNRFADRIMIHLRNDFSGPTKDEAHSFKKLDFEILTLFFAGFSNKSIGFMLNMTEKALRTRRYRYRKIFKASDSIYASTYLARLG